MYRVVGLWRSVDLLVLGDQVLPPEEVAGLDV